MKNKIILFALLILAGIRMPAQSNDPVLLYVKDDPTITFKVMFNAGSQFDPQGKEGLAQITAALISDGGTKDNTYEQILEKLYPLAAGYNVVLGVETATFTGRVHKDNIDKYYDIMIDALLNPAFSENDFKRIKQNTLNYLERTLKYSSDEELGKAVLYNSIYEGTPYGHITAGTIEGVNSITIEDVRNFYTTYYNRNNLVLGVGGSYSDNIISKTSSDLKKLPDGKKAQVAVPDPSPINGLEVTLVEKEADATAISMGFPIEIRRGMREWYALAIANSWLGEHRNSSSHLYQVIREERGLNYGDYSYIEHFPNGGSYQMPPVNYPRRQHLFEIWIRPVPNETRHFSLRAAMRELKKLVDNGMTKDQFEQTKNFLSKYVIQFAPSTSIRLGYALDDKFYGLEESHLEKYRKMMKEITLDEVNSAIKKHLQYENMKIAIVTRNADQLKKDLAADVESPIEYASAKSPNILEEDKEIIKFPLKVEEDNIKIVKVEELF
jgi:zinc protease